MRHRGLCHAQLLVRDLERSIRFYSAAFGLELIHRRSRMAFMRTPRRSEVLTLKQEDSDCVGQNGGVDHIGFPLLDPSELEEAVDEVVRAGGQLIEKGQLEGNIPTAFVRDPDGYKIQI